MPPTGTLLAYSTPVDIQDLRDQAALVSMVWREQAAAFEKAMKSRARAGSSRPPGSSAQLETLTIEFQNQNILVRALQPNLLLVLVGGVPPSRSTAFKISPEASGDARYPPARPSEGEDPDHSPSSDNSSAAGETGSSIKAAPAVKSRLHTREKDVQLGVLHIQRKKLDAMSDFMRAEFQSAGFVMPDNMVYP